MSSEVNKDEVVAALGNMTVIQLIALTKHLEELWDVKAAPQVVQQVVEIPTVEAVAQTEFTVVLTSFASDKKMALVKLVREIMSLGLLESKTLVESLPKPIKDNLTKDEAEILKAKFAEAGALAEVK